MKVVVIIILIVLAVKFIIWVWPYLVALLAGALTISLTSLASVVAAFILWHTCAALFGKTKPGFIANASYERWGWFVMLISLGSSLWFYATCDGDYYSRRLPQIIAGSAALGVLPVMVDVVFTRKRHKNAHPSAIRIHDENTYTLTADGRIAKREPACAMSDLDVNLDITANLSNGSRRRS